MARDRTSSFACHYGHFPMLLLAEQLIEQHGNQAAVVAANKFIERKRACDNDGMSKWVQIMLAIRELTKGGPAQG